MPITVERAEYYREGDVLYMNGKAIATCRIDGFDKAMIWIMASTNQPRTEIIVPAGAHVTVQHSGMRLART